MPEVVYTKRDLQKLRSLYNKNWKKLERFAGKLEQKKYVKIEREIIKEQDKVLKALGLYLEHPCPIRHHVQACKKCTGFYIKIYSRRKGRPRFVMVDKVDDKQECAYKKVDIRR